MAELTFYTHPSRWVNESYPNSTPYDRIAGIVFEDEELWADTSQLPAENTYQKTDTEALTVNVPTEFAEPIVDYFHGFYAAPPRVYEIGDVRKDVDRRSNCHRFGATVLKRCPQDIFTAWGIATEIAITNKHTSSKRALGDLAILASSQNILELPHIHALHSMVSLGNALPGKYIHAVAIGGNLAISPLETFVEDYNEHSPTDVRFADSHADIHPDHQLLDGLKKAWHRK